jgi:hypothetical protein
MAFDTKLADRIRERLGKRKGLTEKKMFGGKEWIGVATRYAGSLPAK